MLRGTTARPAHARGVSARSDRPWAGEDSSLRLTDYECGPTRTPQAGMRVGSVSQVGSGTLGSLSSVPGWYPLALATSWATSSAASCCGTWCTQSMVVRMSAWPNVGPDVRQRECLNRERAERVAQLVEHERLACAAEAGGAGLLDRGVQTFAHSGVVPHRALHAREHEVVRAGEVLALRQPVEPRAAWSISGTLRAFPDFGTSSSPATSSDGLGRGGSWSRRRASAATAVRLVSSP